MDQKTKTRILNKKPDVEEPEHIYTPPPTFMDTVRGWFGGYQRPQTSLKERVAQLEQEAKDAEERAKLTEAGVAAQKRIAIAEQRRVTALKGSIKKSGIGKVPMIIMGILAVVLILIIAGAVKC